MDTLKLLFNSFSRKWILGNYFSIFFIFVVKKKLVNKKYFPVKKNLVWFPEKYFPFILGGKHFLKVVKNLEISYYLLIISNLILKLLIAIYILF
jgi:hypothetical protein